MVQKSNNQQTTYTLLPSNSQPNLPTHNTITDDQLRISLLNINQIMQKINEVVKRTQRQKLIKQDIYKNKQQYTFVTHENLQTQNIDSQQTQLVKKLKNKMNGLKIPLHQLHKKNKLSTVFEESQSQSGRTTYNGITPRGYQNLFNIEQKLDYQSKNIHQNQCFNKQSEAIFDHDKSLQKGQKEDIDQDRDKDVDYQKITKKITGIRKTGNFKINQQDNIQKQKIKQNRIYFKNQQKQQKFTKTRSMANLKSSFLLNKKQLQYQDNDISHTNSIKNSKSKSKSRKGLSLFSKHSLLSDNTEKLLKSIDNTTRHKNKTTSQISSQTKNSKTIVIKRITINPFLIQKKSLQFQKKNQSKNQNKNKNCLSRTNIRQFFVSKRIKR